MPNSYSKYYNSPSSSRSQTQVGSRRAKVEQKKLLQQSVLFGVLAIVLSLICAFVFIPWFIRAVGALSNRTGVVVDDSVPIQVPIVETPVTATTSASIALKGFHEKGFQIVVVNNGQEVQRTTTNDDGSFSTDISLQAGENKLAVYAVGDNEKESPVSPEYIVIFDNEPPKLEVTEPKNGQTIQGKQNQNIVVKGVSDPKTKIYLNDRLVFTREDGSFETTFRLNPGENTLHLKSIDEAGNTSDEELKVTFVE